MDTIEKVIHYINRYQYLIDDKRERTKRETIDELRQAYQCLIAVKAWVEYHIDDLEDLVTLNDKG